MRNRNKRIRILFCCLAVMLGLGLLGVLTIFGINGWVKHSVKAYILTQEQAAQLQDMDCILVLGCKVGVDGTPSHMLEDRLIVGVQLYDLGAAPKLLMSGDHGTIPYNEVQSMKQYAMDNGIPSADIFMDHAGFSTYESIYRAKDIFQAKKILIVTQEYHLPRALYISKKFGLDCVGVSSDYRKYYRQNYRELREVAARTKDFIICI